MSAVVPEDLGMPAALPWAERAWQAALSVGLALLGFFLLFSTAGTAFAMFLLLLVLLAAPARVLKVIPWRDPIIASGLLLLAYIALRGIVETGLTKTTMAHVNHYHELLMMPLVYGVIANAQRPQWLVKGLVIGILALAVLSWMAPYYPDAEEFMMRRRISAGFGMAIFAFLLFEAARLGEIDRRTGYVGAAALVATVLFTGQGRTGQVVLLLLAGCAVWRGVAGRWRVPLAGGVILVLLVAASLSQKVQDRLVETHEAIFAEEHGMPATIYNQGDPNSLNSTAGRFEILNNALGVARDHWLAGVGWAHYPDALQEQAMRRHKDPTKVYGALSVNPHDEYLLQLGAGGVLALLLFIAWLAAPLWRAWRARAHASPWLGVSACIAVAFALGSVFNSLLLDWVEAHFYVSILAGMLAWRVRD